MTDLTISIISTNERHHLEKLLPGIDGASTGLNLEVFVIDNASIDGTSEYVKENFPSFRIIRQENKTGFSSNNNLVLKEGKGKYFLVLNPDTILPVNGLSKMISFHEKHDDAGISVAKLVNPDNSLQYTARRFPRPSAILLRYMGLDKLVPDNPVSRKYLISDWDRSTEREIDWALGAFLLANREFFLSIGGFDEKFDPLYYEDIDLCFRVRKAGKKIFFNPDVVVIHQYHRESAKGCFNKMTYYHMRNIIRFFLKNGIPKWTTP